MEPVKENINKTTRAIPITFFGLALSSCFFNGDVAGVLFIFSFISLLVCKALDPSGIEGAVSGETVATDAEDSHVAHEPMDLFDETTVGAEDVAAGAVAGLQVTPLSGVGESYDEIT